MDPRLTPLGLEMRAAGNTHNSCVSFAVNVCTATFASAPRVVHKLAARKQTKTENENTDATQTQRHTDTTETKTENKNTDRHRHRHENTDTTQEKDPLYGPLYGPLYLPTMDPPMDPLWTF